MVACGENNYRLQWDLESQQQEPLGSTAKEFGFSVYTAVVCLDVTPKQEIAQLTPHVPDDLSPLSQPRGWA